MKNILFAIIFISSSNILKSQTYTQFNLLFTPFGYGESTINNIIDMDSYYFIEGYSETSYSKFIGKIDASGNIIEKRQVPINIFTDAPKYENSLLRIGSKVYNSTYTLEPNDLFIKNPTLVVYDMTLDTSLFVVYPDSIFGYNTYFNDFVDIKLSIDGNLILLGNINNPQPNSCRMFIMKTDTYGSIIWLNIFPAEYKNAYHINVNSDSTYTIFTEKNNGSFFRVDSTGNIISELTINGLQALNKKSSMTNVGDTLYLARTVFDTSNNNSISSCLSLTKYDCTTNTIIFDKIMPCLYPNANFASQYNVTYFLSDILVTTSKRITTYYNGNYYFFTNVPKLFTFNSLGNLIYTKQLYAASGPNEVINDFVQTTDNCILGVGSDDFDSQSWIFKSKPLIGLGFPKYITSNIVNIYPNPTSDFLTIDKLPINFIHFEIYNSSGILCKKETDLKGKKPLKISVKELNSGVYFLILISTDGEKYAKEFIKK